MKLSATIVLLFIASCIYAQSVDKDSRSTKIDEKEKQRIENQYKALSNFYIDDDGLVVYQTQSSSTSIEAKKDTTGVISNSDSGYNKDGNQISENLSPIKEIESDRPLSTKIATTTSAPSEAGYIASQDKSPVRSAVIRKEAARPTEALVSSSDAVINSNEGSKEVEKERRTIRNSPIVFEDKDVENQLLDENKNTDSDKKAAKKTTAKKTSVFDKQKYLPQYKTLEEAALAVEALLDDLKKEQVSTSSAGSMSSRLSGGAGRATLRKKPASSPSYSASNSGSVNSQGDKKNNAVEEIDQSTSEFGYEPSYFINGKEVDKVEVNRLRKKEIINKEVRTRNTVSGNPNGEVWYEVKYDN